MKAVTTLLHVAVLCGAAFFATTTTFSRTDSPKSAAVKPATDLQISVDVPPTWRPFLDDNVAEAFASQVRTAFKRQGYKGRIDYVERWDDPKPAVPLLVIRLHEWRIGRTGNAECTFAALLRTAEGEKELGLVSGTTIFWSHGGRWGLARMQDTADALEDTAQQALRDLFKRVAATGTVPDLKTR